MTVSPPSRGIFGDGLLLPGCFAEPTQKRRCYVIARRLPIAQHPVAQRSGRSNPDVVSTRLLHRACLETPTPGCFADVSTLGESHRRPAQHDTPGVFHRRPAQHDTPGVFASAHPAAAGWVTRNDAVEFLHLPIPPRGMRGLSMTRWGVSRRSASDDGEMGNSR